MTEPQQEKEFMTLDEVADYVGVKKPSLYYYMDTLNIKTHRFKMNKRAYIALADVKRIKEVRETPWTSAKKEQLKEDKPVEEMA